jgi:hypothetical protein
MGEKSSSDNGERESMATDARRLLADGGQFDTVFLLLAGLATLATCCYLLLPRPSASACRTVERGENRSLSDRRRRAWSR